MSFLSSLGVVGVGFIVAAIFLDLFSLGAALAIGLIGWGLVVFAGANSVYKD